MCSRLRRLHQASAWLPSHLSDCPALTNLQISLPRNLLAPALADVEQPEDITLLLVFFPSETKSVTVEKAGMNTSVTQVEMCCFNFPLAFQQRNPGCGGSVEIYLLAAVNPH